MEQTDYFRDSSGRMNEGNMYTAHEQKGRGACQLKTDKFGKSANFSLWTLDHDRSDQSLYPPSHHPALL
jgi:hypothetical protein